MRTQKYNAVIVDDEEDGRKIISVFLTQLFPEITIAGTAENADGAYDTILETDPDIIFLDIELPDGTSFDLLNRLPKLKSEVIFVTAYDQYALKAIKASALDYLLKPVRRDEFELAVSKAINKLGKNNMGEAASHIVSMINHKLNVRKITIPTMTGFSLVNVDQIIRCEASDNYTIIHFADMSKVTASRSLYDYEVELKDYGFIRIHDKHLVSLKHVCEYKKGKDGGAVVMSDHTMLDVSVRKKALLVKALS